MSNTIRRCFIDSTPSIFLVCSPLQAMCAINAIKEFKIHIYKFILVLVKDKRNQQLFTLLAQYHIQYEIIYSFQLGKFEKYNIIKANNEGYKRAFIGDMRSLMMHTIAFKNLQNNSDIVYLDDGNDTISLLKGMQYSPKGVYEKIRYEFIKKYFAIIGKSRKITFGKFLYTIYDIPNDNYVIRLNNLDTFIKEKDSCAQNGIYIIGTNFSMYCQEGFVSKDVCKQQMEKLFCCLTSDNKDTTIYYIPHGRDIETFPKELCRKYSVIYHPVDISVELYMKDLEQVPLEIYGYTSSALVNLKMMFPTTRIVDMVFDVVTKSRKGDEIKLISDYYKTIGIQQLRYHF